MTSIPQRELRNNVSDVLRRAESGQHFTITVDGRPVADLGPLSGPRHFAAPERLRELIADTPVDVRWVEEVERARAEDRAAAVDAWRG